MGEKTEKASPKKLRDARKKGQVAKSQDLPSAFTFITSISLVLMLSNWFYQRIGAFLNDVYSLIPHSDLYLVIPTVFREAIMVIFSTAIPVLVLVACVGVVINFLSIGPVFSVEVFKPDIKKFNVVQNLKNKFKIKTLVELIKSLFKITVAAYLIYGVLYSSLPVLVHAVHLDMIDSLAIFYHFLLEVVIKVGVFFIFVAVLDFAYQKYNFGKEMMMEKFEVKQEYKNTEGDPQIKSKRKQTAREIAYSSGPTGGMQKAKAVVTNPVHLAVAVAYDREIDVAPYILTMGEGMLAKEIVKLAKEHDIPIVRNISLAHKLWEEGDVYEYVPEDTYQVMAEILLWINSMETGYDEEMLEAVMKED